ncbi:hypothetical protein [Nocardia sputi]|uniref:hypothetical protein n=1 Tax=Nocardia sputi TaxID=2943705 RepID=UPI0020BEA274|nr:hypothetical protein [Nocardia sputi]
MTRRGRGSTGHYRPSALPEQGYQAPTPVRDTASGGLVVDFHGEDGRRGSFDVGKLPLPGWHPLLAQAFALRTGPSGGLRTLAGAQSRWLTIGRWTQFLAGLDPQPVAPAQLARHHVNLFHTRIDSAAGTRSTDMAELQLLFGHEKVRDQIPADARDALARRVLKPSTEAVGGYSTGEMNRLTAAARADTATIARRIRASEALIRQWREDPDAVEPQQRQRAQTLTDIAATGAVPPGTGFGQWAQRRELASQLFLTWGDLAPLLILLSIVTERNGETLKELPVEHRLLEGRAVEVDVTKRRRGANRWFDKVTWEIGPKTRELHTPGGLYLLLLELTARSRDICGSSAAICLWRNGHREKVTGTQHEHYAPFATDLRASGQLVLTKWAQTRPHPVLADPIADAEPGTADEQQPAPSAAPLTITFNRIKTTVDARRTRQLGGHLPSAAKTNTAQVLYSNYLKPDAGTRDWAEGVIADALADAEEAARAAHARITARRGSPTVLPGTDGPDQAGLEPGAARDLAEGRLDTAWSACADFEHHPETGKACGDSFLLCFHCGNCLVTRDHLPRLLSLLDALNRLRRHLSEEQWWKRYGSTWVAVRRDILGKFSEAEVTSARQQQVPDALLDLVENPWETP